MSDQLVTGIFPSSDVSELERALGASAGVDHSKLSVITSHARTQTYDDSFLNFVHVAEYLQEDTIADDMTHGTGEMTDSGGTSVPGLTGGGVQTMAPMPHRPALNYLAGLPIPEDQIDNYNAAIEGGRAVATYRCSDAEAAAIQAAFRDAGLRNVRAFASTN